MLPVGISGDPPNNSLKSQQPVVSTGQSTYAITSNPIGECDFKKPTDGHCPKPLINVKSAGKTSQMSKKPSIQAAETISKSKQECEQVLSNVSRKRIASNEKQTKTNKKLKSDKDQEDKLCPNLSIASQPSADIKLPTNEIDHNSMSNIELQSTSDIANEFLDNLQMSSDDPSHGSLSPTAAFLLSFPVVSSVINRPIDAEQVQQLSPSDAGLLVMNAEHNITTNDQQLLDKISSLFTDTTPRNIDINNTGVNTEYKDIESVVKKPVENTVQIPRVVEKAKPEFRNTKVNEDLLNLNSSAIQTVIGKPRELYESQTFAEILESLKASPSKSHGNNEANTHSKNETKHSGIPNFSFSSNVKANHYSSNTPASFSKLNTTSAPAITTSGGFYETLSSIKPIVSSSMNDGSPKKTPAGATTAKNNSSTYSVSKLTNKQEYTNSFILPPVPFKTNQANPMPSPMLPTMKATTENSFSYPPSIVPSYSSMNAVSSYTYDPLIAANITSSIAPSAQSITTPTTTLNHQPHISTALHSTLSLSSTANTNKSITKEASFPSFAFSSNVPRTPDAMGKNKHSQHQIQPIKPKEVDAFQSDITKAQKKHINWMTSTDESKVQSRTSMGNCTALNSYSTQMRNQAQTPQSFFEDNVPWSPNRLLDPHGFRAASVLPTLHGDLALHTIGGENSCNTLNYNARPMSTQKAQLNTPNKLQQSNEPIRNVRNSSQFIGTANFFSVSQLVDDVKEQRKPRPTINKQISFSHTTQKNGILEQSSCTRNENTSLQSQFLPTMQNQAAHVNSHSGTTTATCSESYSIPNLMSEPVKTTFTQQLSNNYSAEALISGYSSSAPNSAKKKMPSSFIASNSLSLEFYNPADSLMDFSISNEIFNPYLAHGNLQAPDANFIPISSNYSDSFVPHHPSATENTQQNFDIPLAPSIPAQNHTIANITQNYPSITSSASSSNFHTPQFSILSSDSKDNRKSSSNYTTPTLSFESGSSNNVFTTSLAHNSSLVPISQSVPSTESMNATSTVPPYSLPSFKTTSHQHLNYQLSANNAFQYRTRHSSTYSSHVSNQYCSTANDRNTANGSSNSLHTPATNHLSNSGASNSNVLTNFNLSTICPEISSEKNSNWS